MAEYLNKEKIENKLREKAKYYFDRYYNDKTALRYHHKAIGYESAADEIRMTLPENIWRNAEQDPPEENTPVLCYAVSTAGEGHFKVIGVLRNKEFWFLQVNDARWSSFPNMQLRVTHWQPLPEDPEEE